MQWKQKDAILSYVDEDSTLTKLAKINGIKDIFGFLNPSKEDLHSPYGLKNIELAADRIIDAIAKGENISIYGDADNDGANSLIILYQYLSNFTKNVSYFHTQRSCGHGIYLMDNKVPELTQLLIIVDSSTNDVESCRKISSGGVDIIILDHHEQDKMNPHCILVNPHQEGCSYKNKFASGAVIVWKACMVIDDKFGTKYADEFYDLCAIGLYGDLMDVSENSKENRYIVDRGLRNIRNLGIKTLLLKQNKDLDKLKSSDIGYNISPFINAACRLDKIEIILDFLNETDINQIKLKVENVIDLNEERKRLQAYHTVRIMPQVDGSKPISIIIDSEIGKGFRGLVASEIAEKFKICSMIISEDEVNTYSGSYRAVNDFDLKRVLEDLKEIIQVGGHGAAGGSSFKIVDLNKIQSKLNRILKPNMINQYIEYDLEVNLKNLTEKMIVDFEKFYHISGKGIKTGKFKLININPINKKTMGKENDSLKIGVYPMDETYFMDEEDIVKLIPEAFILKFRTNSNYFADDLIGKEVQVIGELNLNIWTTHQKRVIKTKQVMITEFSLV